jgi:Protein of unknown function (DUF4235)
MTKVLFRPVALIAGLLAGRTSRRTFDLLWRRIDRNPPPRPDEQRASAGKLALALLLEGAVLRVVKGLIDHVSRRGFAKVTGRWPGEKRSAPE